MDREERRLIAEKKRKKKEKKLTEAKEKTEKIEKKRELINSLLKNIRYKNEELDWEKDKNNEEFNEILKTYTLPERLKVEDYEVKSSLLYFLFPSIKTKNQEELTQKYEVDLKRWEKEYERIATLNKKEKEIWNVKKINFEKIKKEKNDRIDKLKKSYELGKSEGVKFYFKKMLENIIYPEYFLLDWQLEFEEEGKLIIINYDLPKKSNIPNVKQVKYIQTRDEIVETYVKDNEINKIYEEALYQLCLRVNYDIYKIDKLNHIRGIIFNGYLTDINKSNGKIETKCIISLKTDKEKFKEINIEKVDSKLCFKALKGTAGAKISDLVAVVPMANIDTKDKRFVTSHEVGESINGYNLANMHWEEFEHLIREVFEKVFATEGAEVNVTQASRDGGVDAVIFDSDPIKGGKYIVQAKRYTNVVGVSAVRDLYGTVMNEGASKGILVTTSSYGNDSYEFAKGKPITLLDGSNLLHILKEHGYEARIDLYEAKLEIKKNNSYKR